MLPSSNILMPNSQPQSQFQQPYQNPYSPASHSNYTKYDVDVEEYQYKIESLIEIIEFLRLFCENHNQKFQNYIYNP